MVARHDGAKGKSSTRFAVHPYLVKSSSLMMQSEAPARFILHFQLYQSGVSSRKSWSEGSLVSLACPTLCYMSSSGQLRGSGKACFAVNFEGSLRTRSILLIATAVPGNLTILERQVNSLRSSNEQESILMAWLWQQAEWL